MQESIKKRTSIRTYQKKSLSDKDHQKVINILNDVEKQVGPFGHKATFFYVKNQKDNGKQYGTYGFIKDAPAFIGGVIENTTHAMVDYGYLFEQIILRITKINLGTVWLGGTFNRREFNIDTNESQVIPAISPVGYLSGRSIREKLIRKFAKADKRKKFNELFFEGGSLKPIDQDHPYADYLYAVQVGPSASNKQPWRIVIEGDTFHLYLERTKGYASGMPIDIQSIDMGIALSHLVLALKDDQKDISFVKQQPYDVKEWVYIISVLIN